MNLVIIDYLYTEGLFIVRELAENAKNDVNHGTYSSREQAEAKKKEIEASQY